MVGGGEAGIQQDLTDPKATISSPPPPCDPAIWVLHGTNSLLQENSGSLGTGKSDEDTQAEQGAGRGEENEERKGKHSNLRH